MLRYLAIAGLLFSVALGASGQDVAQLVSKFSEKFPPSLPTANTEVKYKISRENFPNLPAAESYENKRAKFLEQFKDDAKKEKYAKSYDQIIAKLRSGEKLDIQCRIDVSPLKKFNVEYIYKYGYVERYFLSPTSSYVEKPTERTLQSMSTGAGEYMEITSRFPMALNCLKFSNDSVRFVVEKGTPFLEWSNRNLALDYRFEFTNGTLKGVDIVNSLGNVVTKCAYNYEGGDSIFPKNISVDSFDGGGNKICHDTWELLSTQKLPNDYQFEPTIGKDCKVLDGNTDVPSDEFQKILTK